MNPVVTMLLLGIGTTLCGVWVGYLHGRRQRATVWDRVCYPGGSRLADRWYWRTMGPHGRHLRLTEEAVAVGESREGRDAQ